MGLSHCGVWTVSEARRLFTVCEKNLGVRHRDINLLHLPLPLHAVLNFVKHLLSAKIRSRICSHGGGGGDKVLWAKFDAGSDALPPEVSGDRGLHSLLLVVVFLSRKHWHINVSFACLIECVMELDPLASCASSSSLFFFFHVRACLLPGRRLLAAQPVRDGGRLEEGADEEQEEAARQGQDDGMEGFFCNLSGCLYSKKYSK